MVIRTMIGLDTNVLVRLFAHDGDAQSELARDVLDTLSPAFPGFVSVVVVAELVWVLARSYRASRTEVRRAVRALLDAPSFIVEAYEVVERALKRYATTACDFADCLIACTAAEKGCRTTLTFDRRAARNEGFFLLTGPYPMGYSQLV